MKQWTCALMMAVVGCLAGLGSAEVVWEDNFDTYDATAYNWNTSNNGSPYWASPTTAALSGHLRLQSQSTSSTFDNGSLVGKMGVAAGTDGVISFYSRFFWETAGLMYIKTGILTDTTTEPIFRDDTNLSTGVWTFSANDGSTGAADPRLRLYVNGSQEANITDYSFNPGWSEGDYGYLGFELDTVNRTIKYLYSADGSTWATADELIVGSSTYDDLMGASAYYPAIMMSVNNNGGGGNKRIYIDRMWAEAVPEPATMALLGVGGLALLKRRR